MDPKAPAIALSLALLLLLPACDKGGGSVSAPAPAAQSLQAQPTPHIWPPEAKNGDTVGFSADDLLRRNFYIVLDGSGSMTESNCAGGRRKFEAAVEAVRNFADSAPQDANLGLLIFDGMGTSERVPLGINNREAYHHQLLASRPENGTPLKTAIGIGVQALTNQASRQLGYGEYNLIVVTDGEASTGEDPTKIVNRTIDSTPIAIQTIGFCIDSKHSLNQPGRTKYVSVENAAQLNRELQSFLAEAEDFNVSDFR